MALYLLTGPQTNRVGLFLVSFGAAAEDLNMRPERVKALIDHVCAVFEWQFDPYARVLWIPSWWSFNAPSENEKNFRGALSDLNEVPRTALISSFCSNLADIPTALQHYLHGWETLLSPSEHRSNSVPITVRTQDKDKEQDQDKDKEQDSALSRGDGVSDRLRSDSPFKAGFDEFWNQYPRKVGKDAAWSEWQKLKPGDDLLAEMLMALKWQRVLPDWLKDGGQFVPHPRTYLHRKRWADEQPKLVSVGHIKDPIRAANRARDVEHVRYGEIMLNGQLVKPQRPS